MPALYPVNCKVKVVIKKFNAAHAGRWIAAGVTNFRKAPAQWLLLIALLFAGSRLLYATVVLSLIALLMAPNFLAGLWHGAQAVEQGKPLRIAYLISGFLKNAASLITIGGVSLLGKFVAAIVLVAISGESVNAILQAAGGGAISGESAEGGRAVKSTLMAGVWAALLVLLPFVMATWFAPLLVFFGELKPMHALACSIKACVRNALPLLLFGLFVLTALVFFMPFALVLRQPDLGLWLLAPVLVPAIYASYVDIFQIEPDAGASQPGA